MSLTLTIENMDRLENGEPVHLKLDRHGAVIGRSPHADWSLPDPKSYISSTHCEIDYRNGAYTLIDKSTNGTFVNNATQRLEAPHVLIDGDVIGIGHYKITARTQAPPRAAAPPPDPKNGGWNGWDAPPAAQGSPASAGSGWDQPGAIASPAAGGWDPPRPSAPSAWDTSAASPQTPSNWDAPPPPPSGSGWAPEPPKVAVGGWSAAPPQSPSTPNISAPSFGAPSPGAPSPGAPSPTPWPSTPTPSSGPAPAPWAASSPATGGWDSPPAASPPPVGGGWGVEAAKPPTQPVSGWDNPQSDRAPVAAEGWDKASAISGRGAMAQNWTPPQTQAPTPSAWDASTPPPATPAMAEASALWGAFASSNEVDWGRSGFGPPATPGPTSSASAPAPVAQPPAPAVAAPDPVWQGFLRAAGLEPGAIRASSIDAAETAGLLLRRLVAGLVVMVEARAKAKAQLGAQSTTLELNGNNPIKFARDPERVLAQLLSAPERGFMTAERAVEDSFQDLQAHQMATLAAMQGALASTLTRFSPEAIRKRAESRGVLAKIIPAAREAELWNAYEREFEGVAKGSDEAFMDVFAKEFKQAYEQAAAGMKRRG